MGLNPRLAGVLVCLAGASAPALAQSVAEPSDAPVYIESDTLIQDQDADTYFARGDVRIRQEDRTVYADELEYRPATGRVIARGHVAIFGQGAFPQYADEIELDNELGEGVAVGFSTMLENNGRTAAAFAVRRENGTVELTDAYYTACEMCEETGDGPTWRLRADRVVQDTDDEMIYYRDVVFEVGGVPVFYSPVFAHPDPSIERRSGFLFPGFGVSSRLGAFYQQPYHWVISPSQDLTVSPRLMTNVRPLVEADYRKRFFSGRLDFEGSLTYEREIDSDGERFGDEDLRWHLFGAGEFDVNQDWQWGFGVQAASDDLHMRRYDITEVYANETGLLLPDSRRLLSQIYVQGRTDTYYAELAGATIQSLRIGEDDNTLPTIAPLAEFRQTTELGDSFGRLRNTVSTVALTRDNGVDYRRASAGTDWRTQIIGGPGIVFEPFAQARADYYSFNDLPGALPGTAAAEDSFGRFLGRAGAEMRWPFFRPGDTTDWIVEPVVQAVYASEASEAGRIVNEDSISVDLDETLLFATNRAPGADIWEEGSRVAYGVRATAFWGDSLGRFRGFLGQSQRLDGDPVFGTNTGLFDDASDIVAAAEINMGGFTGAARSRIDSRDADFNRLEFLTSYTSDFFTGSLRYIGFNEDLARFGPSQEVILSTRTSISDHWSVVYNLQRDLDLGISRRQEIGLLYRDFCTEFEILYQRENLNIGPLGPSESIQVRINLFTLGALGSDD
tara:strand:- start:923 stop:3115 length:2193 start_codon:yes stop_codon:yes gene_type:complete